MYNHQVDMFYMLYKKIIFSFRDRDEMRDMTVELQKM
jgi:hypothetical protein